MHTVQRFILAALVVGGAMPAAPASAQDLFEIQVYPYDTVEPGRTILEFHTNFIPSGTKLREGRVLPNDQQFHLTMELTHGFSKRFEIGFYLESAPYVPDAGAKFVGWHVRPRFSLPEYQSFPFKMSFSFEYAFNQPEFEPNAQTLEIRPIFERERGRLYLSINPSLSVAVKGPDAGSPPGFGPSGKIGWDWSKKVAAGIEYYSETGTVRRIEPLSDQQHIIFGAADLNLSPDWEVNFGLGRGLTGTSEHWVVKSILGYRFRH
jgi:hypothetical protein